MAIAHDGGDKVVTRFCFTATHTGEFLGVADTGKSITLIGIWIHRLAGGRIRSIDM